MVTYKYQPCSVNIWSGQTVVTFLFVKVKMLRQIFFWNIADIVQEEVNVSHSIVTFHYMKLFLDLLTRRAFQSTALFWSFDPLNDDNRLFSNLKVGITVKDTVLTLAQN